MAEASERWHGSKQFWWARPEILVELFAITNLGFLTFDIYLAHSVNQFRNPAEYVPLIFSASAPLLLIFALAAQHRWPALTKFIEHLVGWAAVLVGLSGVIFHLQSHFFYERTLRSLTYSAPFAAPLAYTGLGFLLLLNRMVDAKTLEWAQWVLLMVLGGFIGNFIFSLTDHAENGFFRPLEWAPVIASALAVGFLVVPLIMRVSRQYIRLCAAVLLLEGGVGLWGFALHVGANLQGLSIHAFDNFIYGAPPLAPLLFPNLMVLGFIALGNLERGMATWNQESLKRSDSRRDVPQRATCNPYSARRASTGSTAAPRQQLLASRFSSLHECVPIVGDGNPAHSSGVLC